MSSSMPFDPAHAPDAVTLAAAIAEQSPDAIVFADRDGVIRFWNGAAEAMFGWSKAEALGQSLDLMVPERVRAAHWAGFDAALASGKTKHSGKAMTTRSLHKDGRRLYVEMSFGLVRDAAGTVIGALACARDGTEAALARAAARSAAPPAAPKA
jgi:PAS domain S-box-containing protein